jgi:peptidoglycan/LPS O-acetylase OafA/YrhL
MMVVLFVLERTVAGGTGGQAERFTPIVFLTSLTLTHAWFSVDGPNMPAWSISAEWFAYLFFPLLVMAAARIRRSLLLLTLGAFAFAELAAFVGDWQIARLIAGFLLGMAVFLLHQRSGTRPRSPWLGLGVMVATLVWVGMPGHPRLDVSLVLFAVLIFALSNHDDRFGRVLKHPWLVYLGEVSYAVYMFHWIARVMVRVISQKFGFFDELPAPVIVLTYVGVTMIGAVLLYHLVERPGRRSLRSLASPQEPSAMRVEATAPSGTPGWQEREGGHA